jgi:hypothetical protein
MAATITMRDYEQAEREMIREEATRGFRIHATVYVLVNLLLLTINLLVITQTTNDMIWFVFPLLCWGFGLTMHYVVGIRRLETYLAERQQRIEQRAMQA